MAQQKQQQLSLIIAAVLIDSVGMDILNINDLKHELLEMFLQEQEGEKNIFSKLASSQTGNDRTVPKERIEYIMASSDHVMSVAVEGEKLVGMTVGQRVTGIANAYMYVQDLVVDPGARGGGVGTQLVEKILSESKEKWPEVVRVQLTSRPSRGAGPFFQKLGFRPRTKEADDETIVYVKDLDGYTS
ncbi:MAG: ribosomal protein S18 acetylase RimI-like enzyme [Candidatus Azotimanducaceae bacterium]|jgi:ribosomal protein S18 acetylase RimI-like enzyme